MKIPKTLKIGGHIFKITIGKLTQEGIGECDRDKNIITISETLSKSQQEATLIHEILHALNVFFESSEHYHMAMESLAEQLYQVLNDNKMLK